MAKEERNRTLNAKKRPLKRYEEIMIFSVAGKDSKAPIYYPQMQKTKPRWKAGSYMRSTGDSIYQCRSKGKRYYSNGNYPTNVLEFKKDAHTLKSHPTAKPVGLLEYIIKTYTKPGETVLDPFMGSGSTGIACVNTKRNFIGVELSLQWYSHARKRIELQLNKLEDAK